MFLWDFIFIIPKQQKLTLQRFVFQILKELVVVVANKFFHWKRIVHIIVTILLVVFLIWYYLPENKLLRSVDICGYYSIKSNQTCVCVPTLEVKGPIVIVTVFYPNGSVIKTKPSSPKIDYNISFGGLNVTR